MGFLYFYLSMGHFEITVVTNSSDLKSIISRKLDPHGFTVWRLNTPLVIYNVRSQASSPVERYADYKPHCLHGIG